MAYLNELTPVLLVLLGWFLGLVALPINEAIRGWYRRRDLMRAVVDELGSMQYTMAVVAYRIRVRNAQVTDEFLDQILPILENYTGPDRNERFVDGIKASRNVPEQERMNVHQRVRKANAGLSLRQYGLPLFGTQIADLAVCSLDFQRSVLHIRYHLDLLNQPVPYLHSLIDKTFADLSDTNHLAVTENLENGYRDYAERAEIIFKAIGEMRKRYPADK